MHPISKKFNVVEIFSSIQGESTFSGVRCTFIRLSGCNLRCTYCDTDYAYSGGEELTITEIIKRVEEFETPIVEITGGEPLMHKGVDELAQELLNLHKEVLIETNGSYSIKTLPKEVVKIIDIKTPTSGEGDSFLQENLAFIDSKDEVKFVIGSQEDYNWSLNFIKSSSIVTDKIIFSPVWGVLEPQELTKWIVQDRAPVRLGLQIHKFIWDAEKRGV